MSLTRVISDYFLANSFEQAKINMRNDLFSKLITSPAHYIMDSTSGEMNYRIFGDSETIESFFNNALNMRTRVSQLLISVLNNLWSFGILWYGGGLVLEGQITLGTLTAFMMIAGMLFPNLEALTTIVFSFQDVRASLHRFLEYYNLKPIVSELPNAKTLVVNNGEVIFNNVTFGYSSNNLILKGVTAVFKPKSITAIVGRNGVGKSTLARLLIRMFDPLEGSIIIDNTDIREVTLKSLRNNIGYLIQGEFLFSGTIWDNILYGSDSATEEEVIEACRKACIYDFIMSLPNNFQTKVGEGGF